VRVSRGLDQVIAGLHLVAQVGPILRNDEDFVLTLMKTKKHDPIGYPEAFHVGLYLENPHAMHTKHDELAVAGLSPGEIQGAGDTRGTHFNCTAPGNVLVEIATPPRL
jgi:hypothetical protein